MGRLDGKVVLLTGAGAGIAKAAAKACVREGARVALLEIDREAGQRAADEIDATGAKALFVANASHAMPRGVVLYVVPSDRDLEQRGAHDRSLGRVTDTTAPPHRATADQSRVTPRGPPGRTS